MSFLNDKTKFTVKTSNLSTVARFSSTLDDAYFLVLANNSNYYQYGCNNSAAVFGANSASNFEAYIGVAKNNVIQKLARFNNTNINLNTNVVVTGNVIPSSNIVYDLGTPEYRWRDLFLSGNSIYLGDSILSSDTESGSLVVKNSSNEIAPMVTSKVKLLSSGSTSNYSVFTSTDYGINLTFYDENDNEINHLDLGQADTSFLPEGSNLYYTFERFDERLLTKTLDNIIDGSSNRYIVNDIYNRDLHITGTLSASNLIVYGDRTTLNTETYQTEQLQISSDTDGPVLTVKQYGSNDIVQFYSASNVAFVINNAGLVGINTSNPQYELDVQGIANATYLRGDASQLWNVNLEDRSTSLLSEGSNLYYTSERVGIIATSSNVDTSNYIQNTSNEISSRLTDTSNFISERLTDTSNLISDRLTDTSNVISNRLTETSNLISDRLTETSNLISTRLTDTSNLISNRITALTTDEITEGNNMYYTTQRFDERLLTKTLDNVYNGTSNKYIINDVYNSDLNITGTLTASNLIVNGTFTTLDTITYQAKKLEIVSDSESPALLVRQSGLSNIMEIYDDSNIVLSVVNDGFVGVNKLAPLYALDVEGTLNATYFVGDGVGLSNVNLSDRNTSMLAEGSNLYYTAQRVGIISTSSNVQTSNYILSTSNSVSTNLTNTSNKMVNDMLNVSNIISNRITALTTDEIAEGNNLYYTAQRFDERLDSKTADYIANGSSNRYIVNDVYNRDLTVTGSLTASNLIVQGDITTLNTNTYQTERMEIVSDVAGPALKVTQKGDNDILYVYDDTNIALSVIQGGNVGINTITPTYTLDVVGTARATYLVGDASGLSNVNLADRDTSMLVEGSNLYYTSERVGVIATSSNIETSNYILVTSNYLIEEITDTSNILTNTINNVVSVEIENTCNYLILTSNLLISNIIDTSNILTFEINETINNEINTTIANLEYTSNEILNLVISTSNELTNLMNNVVSVQVANSATELSATSNQLMTNIKDTSNQLTDTINNVVNVQITNASNFIVNTSNLLTQNLDNYFNTLSTRINNLTTDNIPEGSNLYYTDDRFDAMLQTKSLDDILDGTSNRYIVNGTYVGDLYVSGTLSMSNLTVNGTTTTLNTTTYQSKKLEIISDAIGPALKVQQNGIFDIMQVYDDSNIVLSIVNGGKVGINTSNPVYTFDVMGTTRASYLIGDGAGLTNVNFLDRNTSMLVEGSNLYYTSERVGVIATSSNANTSNYILNTSNVISNMITNVSNQLSTDLLTTSNNLYNRLIQSSNLISNNLFVTSNYLMTALINTSNLAVSTSNEIMSNLNFTFTTYTSNFLVNSNLLASNITVTSNNIASFIQVTYANITSNIVDTSNALINNVLVTSNNLILNTSNTFIILSSNLNNVSNLLASNIPVVYNSLYVNLYNVSNIIATQINNASNAISINITVNSNIFTDRILITSNNISTTITLTSNEFANRLTETSNIFNALVQLNSNQIYTYYNETSNAFSRDILYNSNVISKRISDLNLDMIAPGTSNTYIVNNIYDANLTITGKLVVDSLDVVDLGLLELNADGEYINTDMRTYVARITSNVLAYAPSIIMNASNNFDGYDIRQSNYVRTKQDLIVGAASTVTTENLLPNRVLITNNSGKLASSTVVSSNLDMLATLNAPIQTQINSLNINSSNLALGILDRVSFLNNNIGLSTGGTGNNLSVTNVVTTCNVFSLDPVLQMKFEDLNDSSKYASKNFLLMKPYSGYTNHINDIMLWYKFNGNTNNHISSVNSNLYLVSGNEMYSANRADGLSSALFNGYTSYTMGMYNNIIVPSGIRYMNDKGITISFWMNSSNMNVGRQYVFSYSTSNLLNADCAIEAYINTSNLCLSVSRGSSASVYNMPLAIQSNLFYNVTWEIAKNTSNENTINSNFDSLWYVYVNGLAYSNVIGFYPSNCNYTYNTYGGQTSVYSSNFFNGIIDDFRVYGKLLTDSEIYQNSGINYPNYDGHVNDLLLWYNFDGHLSNYDGNSNYDLNLGAGTMNYTLNKVTSLYSVYMNGSSRFIMNTGSAINFNTVSTIYPRGLTFCITFSALSVGVATQYLFALTDTVNSTTPTRSIEVYLTTNQLNFRVRQNGTTTMQTVTLNSGLVAYRYYNISWVITPGASDTTASWYIYLNGMLVHSMEGNRYYPITGTYSHNHVGALFNTNLFTGFLDDFRVYRKSLSADEVGKISSRNLKYATFANHSDNLVSWFNFDGTYNNSMFDSTIPLVYLNFQDKKMIAYNDTDNYILYNSSNITPVYASIGNVTMYNNAIPDYNVNNSYALVSTMNTYVYYVNQFELINTISYLKKGFLLHFAFKADKVINIPIYYLGNATKRYVSCFLYCGCIYVILGEGVFNIQLYTDNNLNANSWYIVDIVSRIVNDRIGFEMYINGVRQNIIMRYSGVNYYDSNVMIEYKPSLLQYGFETTEMYVGGFNPRNTSNNYNGGGYNIGAILTTYYYSSNVRLYYYSGTGIRSSLNVASLNILNTTPGNSANFNSYVSQVNDNKYWAYRSSLYLTSNELANAEYSIDSSNLFSLNDLNPTDINSMLIEVLGNFYVDQEGFYYFALDLQNEIACELVLTAVNNFGYNETFVVSAYYGGNLLNPSNNINNCRVTQYPIKLNVGYYKLSLKVLRKSVDTVKYIIAKYYRYDGYVGTKYSLLSKNVTYINYSSLNPTVRNNMTEFATKLYTNDDNTITSFSSTNPIVVGDDYGVFVYGTSNNTSNAMGVGGSNFYMYSNVLANVMGSNFPVKMFSNIADVSTGSNHSLVLLTNGTVYSCGANNAGQLGIGLTVDNNINKFLKQVLGIDGAGYIMNVVQVSAGDNHSMFLQGDGSLYGCGLNQFGQLGLGNTTFCFNILKVSGITSVRYVSAGVNTSLVIKNDGTAWGCGRNDTGQLAQGVIYTCNASFVPILDIGFSNQLTDVKEVQAGGSWSLFLKNDGTCYATGGNSNIRSLYQIFTWNTCNYTVSYTSNYNVDMTSNYNVDMTSNYNVDNVDYTSNYTVPATSNYSIPMTSNYTINFTSNEPFSNIAQISAKADLGSLFLTSNNNVFRSTSNILNTSGTITKVATTTAVSKVAQGKNIYFLGADGKGYTSTSALYGVGQNDSGQLGLNYATSNVFSIVPVSGLNGAGTTSGITQISARGSHSLFLHNSGTVYACGYNMYGHLGINSTTRQITLVQVLGLGGSGNISGITQISTGTNHSLFLHSTGAVYACGLNDSGQLGINNRTNQQILVQVLGLVGSGNISGITQISAGANHSLFLHNSGIVYACGWNLYGQLGINNTTDQLVLRQVLGLNGSGNISGITQISAGADHSLFLHSSGTVYACGLNAYGQLGINNTTNPVVLVQVLGVNGSGNISGITQISAGIFHSLFLHNSGTVYACGYNAYGQLGINNTIQQQVLVQVLGVNGSGNISGITQISAGYFHSLFLHNSGTVYACGRNDSGQLGINNTTQQQVLVQVLGLGGSGNITGITQIYAGTFHSLFLHSSGVVYACGLNSDGQLGIITSSLKQIFGVNGIGTILGIRSASSAIANNVSLYLHNSGDVYACGQNNNGQLGIGNTDTKYTLTQVLCTAGEKATISGITQVSVHFEHSLFLHKSGMVFACGDNSNGQLGVNYTVPRQFLGFGGVGYVSGITQIVGGKGSHLFFLHSSGAVYACGYNAQGQLGIGNFINQSALVQVRGVGGSGFISGITQIEAGSGHSLFLHNSGAVYACGRNPYGQLGINNTTDQNVLVQVSGLNGSGNISGITQISAGQLHSLFLHSSGTVYACGRNESGRLGINNTTDQLVLRQVLGLNGSGNISGITQISAGDSHSLFLHSSGIVYACGYNAFGQLGMNNTTQQQVLVQVLGLGGSGNISGITQISAGTLHSLFLHSSGAVYACGYNAYGQLGINNTTDQLVLTQVLGLNGSGNISGITQISAGGYHSLFLHSSGVVYVCGHNVGQLGINNTSAQTKLVQVLGLNGSGNISGITQISAGGFQSFFLHSSGAVYACGDNSFGVLGYTFNIPQPVSGVTGLGVLSGITQVSTGYRHSLFLHNSGTVYACGNNLYGQLGINSTTTQQVLVQVLGLGGSGNISGIIQVSAGTFYSLFLHNSGAVYACGFNSSGQLGINSATSQQILVRVLGVGGSGFVTGITQISAGGQHSIFLHSSGTVYSCGNNLYGQLGINSVTTLQSVLRQVLGLNGSGYISGITQISAGANHSLFLHSSGAVYACGYNYLGNLGTNNTIQYLVPTLVMNPNGTTVVAITDISAGNNFSIFTQFVDFGDLVLNSDTVGSNMGTIKQLSAYNHFMLVDNNNVAYSTGQNTFGQLANNSDIDQSLFQYVLDGEGRFDARNIIKVVPYCSGSSSNLASAEYTMFLSSDGSVFFSGEGGVHSGNIGTTPYLTYISGLNSYKITDIACGGSDIDYYYNYTLFLTTAGNVLYTPTYTTVKDSTGANLSNIVRIGCRKNNWLMYFIDKDSFIYQSTASVTGSTFNVSPATNVVGLGGQGIMRNIRQVEGGLSYTVFLANSGEVYVLGDNTYGQLGTGDNTSASVPTYMKGLNGTGNVKDIVKISCGNYYTMVMTKDSRALATGFNQDGILGIGTTAHTNVLKEVLTPDGSQALTGVKDISCGVVNVAPLVAAVLILGQNNSIYINGASTVTTGLLTLLNNSLNISRQINSVHAAGAWLFLNTLKYENKFLYNSSNNIATTFDDTNSTNFYLYDSNYTLNIQDVRMYTPDVMATSNVIVNQLTKGVYNPSTNSAPNNVIYNNNTTFDTTNYYSGYSSLALNSSNSSFVYLQPSFYNFGTSDTTISMWIKGSDTGIKYPSRSFTSNDMNTYCVSSASSNVDTWLTFDNNSNTFLNISSFTQMYSIGLNTSGQLGDNSTTSRTSGYVPMIVPTNDITIVQIAGTANTTGWFVHMLTDTGIAYTVQQAGLTIVNPNFYNNEKIISMASGLSTYFITESGSLYAYGNNTYSQLGNGNSTNQTTPILIPASRWNGEKVTSVATGNYHTFIITESGTIFSIGYNNNGQLGTGNTTNQTTWTLFTSLANVSRIFCSGDQTYMTTTTGLLYSMGVRGNVPFLETSIPSNKKIIKVSFSQSNCAFALSDDGSVYAFGNNPISIPNTTVAQTTFIEVISTAWAGSKLVDVVTGGDHTFYITDKGQVYVVGNNNNGQLNIPTTTTSSKTPILVNIGGARINLIYGGLFTLGYNIVVAYPTKRFIEFAGNRGEFVKFDAIENVPINYAQVSIRTPVTTTTLSYVISARLYGTNASTFSDVNTLWDLLGSYDGTLSYSASQQIITIVPPTSVALPSYRYYAILINSRYNIGINEIGVYGNSSMNSVKTIFDASIDSTNRISINLQSSNIIASITKNNVTKSISISHPNIYNKGVLYTMSYKYNTDPDDATWKVYTNGILGREVQPMPYPETGNYSNILIGRSIYPVNTLYNYFNGNIDDFRIYNRALSNSEVINIYSADRFNTEGNVNNANKFALTSARETFIYNVNYSDIYGILRNIDTNGFTIHFLFKTNDVNNSALYYVGGNRTSKISIKVLCGVLYIVLGNSVNIVSKNKISANTWYSLDLMGNVTSSGSFTLQLYVNNVLQDIYINNVLTSSYTMNYSNLLAPDNTSFMGVYIGANNVNNNVYRDTADFTQGIVFTNTYFSCNMIAASNMNVFPNIVTRPATNSADFSNMIVASDTYYSYKISSNVFAPTAEYLFAYDGSNYLYDNYVAQNNSTTSFILTEVDANVRLNEGFYYFVNDVLGDITAELYIGTEIDQTIRDFTNVANYYGNSLSGVNANIISNENKTTALPIYIPGGYYKFHSKMYSSTARKHLHHKYIKMDNYIGDYYSLVSHFVTYQSYNVLSDELKNQAVTFASDMYVPKMSSNNIRLDAGGSIDASLYAWGTSTYTFDNGVISRGTLDAAGSSYVNVLSTGQPNGALLQNWSFFASATGRAITPLILEFTGGTNYILRGIGRTRTPTVTGPQTYGFEAMSGSNIFLTSNYRFGWRDGTTTTTNSANITYDSTNPIAITTYSMISPASISSNTTYSFATSGGNRTYSFELEFAVNKNHQFGDLTYLGSNYTLSVNSNYNISMSSNYTQEYTSNYTLNFTSNYTVELGSNYTIEYTSNYDEQTSNYSIEYTSNYNVEMSSNYSIEMSSNYSIELGSNYTVEYTSNYGDNETSNYSIEYTSNYNVEMSSNYSVSMNSNYTMELGSNYTIEYTSNYGLQTSNYSIEYTSNYNMAMSSNYSIEFTSNYSIPTTSNYTIEASIMVNTEYTSNYLAPYVPNYTLPQQIFDFNNITNMKGVSSIAHGSSHTIVLKYNGSVFCCGWNNYGQLGIGNTTFYDKFMPVLDVGGASVLTGVSSIGCGAIWSHFIKTNGTVFGCGLNAYGNIGDNTTTQRNTIVQVRGVGGTGFLTDVRQVVGGFANNNVTLFLKNDGTVYGCGNNAFGTLGDNTTTQRLAPVQMLEVGGSVFVSNVKQIATNSTSTYVLKNDGTVYACGANTFGQLGDNSYTQRNTLVQVRGVGAIGFLTNISQIAAHGASAHSLFLRNDSLVYGCGFNGFGQLGRNNNVSIPYAMRVMSPDGNGTISGIIQVANNANSSYLLTYDGTLMSCGGGDTSITSNYGNFGQLGNGFTSNVWLPASVYDASGSNIIRGVSQLSVGGVNTMTVVFNNGNKELWRDNSLYLIQPESANTNVLIQDFRIYNTGSISSNLLSLYGTGNNTILMTAYSTYNEITDANRWMKSKDYYLYNNGVLNRSIYYTEGNVGIGTSAPTASLEIFTTDPTINSIKTNNAIWAQTGVISSSDARIKKNVVDIDDLAALNQILKIEPKTYNYIDLSRGDRTVYGFMAQQIRQVIPQAVEIQTESIPNIYQNATVRDKSILIFDNIVSDKVSRGSLVDIVDSDGFKVRCEVLEIVNDTIIRVNRAFEEAIVFVYGTVIDDFHTLDKSYIYTLNVCATQDIYRQIQSNKKKLDEQNARLQTLMNKVG